jgi:hypothetical protein
VVFYKEEFEIILNHLGWGDPEPVLLFIGIEEAEPYKTAEEVPAVEKR